MQAMRGTRRERAVGAGRKQWIHRTKRQSQGELGQGNRWPGGDGKGDSHHLPSRNSVRVKQRAISQQRGRSEIVPEPLSNGLVSLSMLPGSVFKTLHHGAGDPALIPTGCGCLWRYPEQGCSKLSQPNPVKCNSASSCQGQAWHKDTSSCCQLSMALGESPG